jgi:hypothetical protein
MDEDIEDDEDDTETSEVRRQLARLAEDWGYQPLMDLLREECSNATDEAKLAALEAAISAEAS